MPLEKFEHPTKELDGINYRVIEANISQSRIDFLVKILSHNNVPVFVESNPPKEGADPTFNLLTPQLTFNPIVKVYNRELRTPDGHRVTPDIWNQLTDKPEPNYWDLSKKDFLK